VDQALEQARSGGVARLRASTESGGSDWLAVELVRAPDGGFACRMTDLRLLAPCEVDLEASLKASEARSAGKSRFLASLSHELRTPLNAIMGFADAMRVEVLGPMPPRYRGYAELIHESGELLLELISDVLDMSRVEAERFELHTEVFDAREASAAVIRLMRGQVERAGLTFAAPDMRERIEVRADRRALKQMALNLLSNAVKATPPGGRVTLTLRGEGGDLVLGVTDTGRGILPGDLARLGRPFEQAGAPEQKAAGSGLGLSLVKALAGLHGGELTLRSRPWEGTEAEVRLPVVVEDQTQPELGLS
jgi:cell cycle sensor histidine kinase DivJ